MVLRGRRPYLRAAAGSGTVAGSVLEMQVRVWRDAVSGQRALERDLRARGGCLPEGGWSVLAGPYAVVDSPEEEQKLMNLLWDLRGLSVAPARKAWAPVKEPVVHVVAYTGVPGCVEVLSWHAAGAGFGTDDGCSHEGTKARSADY